MENYEIQKLIDLPIEGVASRLGLKVKRHVSLCPFHADKRPSLHFNPAKNRYRCYVCGAYGRSIDLVMNFLHLDFLSACKWLANENNIILTEYKAKEKSLTPHPSPLTPTHSPLTLEHLAQMVAEPVLTDEAKRFLFEERKLDPRIIEWCKISSTHNDLLIPYFDAEGKFVSVQWRSLHPNPSALNLPRFRFPKGSQCHIYGLQILRLLKEGEPLYITEGASDCWAMLSAGHKAIAIPSATLLKEKDIELLRYGVPSSLTPNPSSLIPNPSPLIPNPSPLIPNPSPLNLHMYPDQDGPGEKLFLRLQEILGNPSPLTPNPSPLITTPSPLITTPSPLTPNPSPIERHQLPQGCKDFAEYYVKMQST